MAEPLPGKRDITLYRGDTRVWTDLLERNVGTELVPVWEPLDLTDHTFLAQIRDGLEPPTTVLATMLVEATGTPGEIRRTLSATQTANLPGPTEDLPALFWDLQVTRTSDGFVRTWLAGKVKVRGDVSRA